MSDDKVVRTPNAARLIIIGLVVTILVLGLALIALTIGRASTASKGGEVDALARSSDPCAVCHRVETPGIVEQYGHSTMAAANVACKDCHSVEADHPGAVAHEGSWVLPSPSAAMCERCHTQEVAQFEASRHSLPAYTAMTGIEPLSEPQKAAYSAIPEGSYAPDKQRNALYALEGPDVTRFACESCHDVGKPHVDGSVGQCQKCHLRHEFSLEQARKPETCNNCHIGPDHPQWEIYEESAHGIAYMTGGDRWNWGAEPGTLTVSDFPAPTCATCHISGFGTSPTTHDVGDRLSWYLFSSISVRRPDWEANLGRMQGVCKSCHNDEFVASLYTDADKATEAINAWVTESNTIVQPLKDAGLLTDAQFDQSIDFTLFETWHHWGRTAKFGSWMQGADYVQWHGAYEILSDLVELRELTEEKLQQAGKGE